MAGEQATRKKLDRTRNFAIVAHVDHGKSTLADRFLQFCDAVDQRKFRDQLLDSLELEREHGITIRSHPVSFHHGEFLLNLIDTPGHVDFSYEVEKSLAATEGVILLVDATQGVQAQTITNLHLAQALNLHVIPVINKVDLPNSQVEVTRRELMDILPVFEEEIFLVSAKSGQGVPALIEELPRLLPPPSGSPERPLAALVFDARHNPYLGVDLHIVVKDGRVTRGDRICLLSMDIEGEVLEIGVFKPHKEAVEQLETGMVGYLTLGFKDFNRQFVGDTVTHLKGGVTVAFPGYRKSKQFVFCGFYPAEGESLPLLRDSLARLQLSDPSFTFAEERSASLGIGFRAGFLGMLHMQIIQERLEREHGVRVVRTTPNTTYRVKDRRGVETEVRNVLDITDWGAVHEIGEPYLKVLITTPPDYFGDVSTLCQQYRAEQTGIEYLGNNLVLFSYEIPLSEIMTDFYNRLKSVTRGYASMDYEFIDYRASDLVKLDIVINTQPVDVLSSIFHRDKVQASARKMLVNLRKNIPRHLFTVVIQASVNGKIIGREEVAPYRKNVTGKCYGGDITRKRKLWEKQKEGKKRLKTVGSVQIPEKAFLNLHD